MIIKQLMKCSAFLVATMFITTTSSLAQTYSIWELQSVNEEGSATHAKVGAAIEPGNKVVVEGIALNAPGEILDTSVMWQVFVQAEGEDQGGIAVFSAIFYDNSEWPRYPMDIEAGDRIRIEGFTAFHNGKTNINERHSAAPDLRFTVTKIDSPGLPDPIVIPALDDCSFFDPQRQSGGEYYQAQWVQLNDVRIASGTWAAGETLTLTDDSGANLAMLLSSQGDFDTHPAPEGSFSVVGIFDQEDDSAPYTEGYRLWVKSAADIETQQQPSLAPHWSLYE